MLVAEQRQNAAVSQAQKASSSRGILQWSDPIHAEPGILGLFVVLNILEGLGACYNCECIVYGTQWKK